MHSVRRQEHHHQENTMSELSGRTTIVVGASRGLGRGIATAFAEAGAPVIAVSRTAAAFPELANGAIQPEVADAADATAAASLLGRYDPNVVVLVAGASPHMRSLQHHTWETFSIHWQTDVRIAFHCCRGSRPRPASANRRSRRTRLALASPSTTTCSRSSGRPARWSRRKSPAPLWCS